MLSANNRSELEAMAQSTGATLLLIRVGGDSDTLFSIVGAPRVKEVDVSAQSMAGLIDLVAELGGTGTAAALLGVAEQLNGAGVAARRTGHYDTATLCYRFALAIAWQLGVWERVELLTRNLQFVRASLDDLLRVNVTAPAPDGPEGATLSTLRYIAGNSTMAAGAEGDDARAIRQLAALIRADARELGARATACDAAAVPDGSGAGDRPRIETRCRLAGMAADADAWRALLFALGERAAESRRGHAALEAILEWLADVALDDLLVDDSDGFGDRAREPGGMPVNPAPDRGIVAIWALFLRERGQLDEVPDLQGLLWRYAFAYRQLQYLRWHATCAGGAFGHRLSYLISGYLQPVGRDYVHLLSRSDQPEAAFAVAEQLHARSMVDWMARTHHTNRLVRDPRLQGSVNAVMPAGPSEIREIARRLATPLLFYLETRGGYRVWLQPPDGELTSDHIDDPSLLIDDLLRRLPYIASGAGLGSLERGQRSLRPADRDDSGLAALETCLRKLYQALFPAKVIAALRDTGRPLTIVTDALLEYVPFCALRADDGRYLAERFDLAYWPSVTAWMLTQTAAEVRAAAPDLLRSQYRRDQFADRPAPSTPASPKAVVIGDPDFAKDFRIGQGEAVRELHLSRLSGTRREADAVFEILGGTRLVGPEATLDNLLDRTNLVPVLHLATHGVLVTERPEDSFVALSDGALCAGFLYQSDRPIMAELVVMSACQTALGGAHPDSLIGLTNAFLIAGADTVVSTLWAIDDERTVDLIRRFYGALGRGVSVAAALCSAQMEVCRQPGLRDPYYWAALKVVGSSANPLKTLGLL